MTRKFPLKRICVISNEANDESSNGTIIYLRKVNSPYAKAKVASPKKTAASVQQQATDESSAISYENLIKSLTQLTKDTLGCLETKGLLFHSFLHSF